MATVASDTFYAALKYNFETSKGATENQRLRSTAYTIGIGPSSSFGTGSLDYNTVNRPWVSDKPFQFNYVTEYDLGYFIYDYEIQMNLAYKNANSSVNGYNLRQSFQRNSITLEAFKYLFDYHGFVPYIGPNINFDTFSFSETDSGIKTIDDSETLISPGVTLGWDIKPVDKMRLVLRTNLRWTFPTPQLFSGKPYQMPANQFEFNFIQFVLFL